MVAHTTFTLDKVTTDVDWLLYKQSNKSRVFLAGQTSVHRAFPDFKVNIQTVTLAFR